MIQNLVKIAVFWKFCASLGQQCIPVKVQFCVEEFIMGSLLYDKFGSDW